MVDVERWLADLESDEECVVLRALHQACPCTGSPALYERHRVQLQRMKKDSRPAVRRVAVHLEVDALDETVMEDERAAGYVRNAPGGHGRRGQPRRQRLT